MDPDIEVVTAIGKAGSGKTLCAIAAALEQTLDE
jgi:PhoH-like ATPase